MNDLHMRLLAAHAAGDQTALITLYTRAADQAQSIDETCFFLTHAYIYALEQGHPNTRDLLGRLKEYGRE